MSKIIATLNQKLAAIYRICYTKENPKQGVGLLAGWPICEIRQWSKNITPKSNIFKLSLVKN
jgi:hypothetical protein